MKHRVKWAIVLAVVATWSVACGVDRREAATSDSLEIDEALPWSDRFAPLYGRIGVHRVTGSRLRAGVGLRGVVAFLVDSRLRPCSNRIGPNSTNVSFVTP